MKLKVFIMIITFLACSLFVVGADYMTRDMIPEGSDVSTFRCSNRVVSNGDSSRDVLKKCGDPIRETRILDEPYRIWIYRFDQSNFINYLGFLNDKLQRIYTVRCGENNPDCN